MLKRPIFREIAAGLAALWLVDGLPAPHVALIQNPPAQSEASARQACLDEARTLGVRPPAGACDTPQGRIRFLTHAREACVRAQMQASGVVRACRKQSAD